MFLARFGLVLPLPPTLGMIAIGCEETPSLLIIIHDIKIEDFLGMQGVGEYIRIATVDIMCLSGGDEDLSIIGCDSFVRRTRVDSLILLLF